MSSHYFAGADLDARAAATEDDRERRAHAAHHARATGRLAAHSRRLYPRAAAGPLEWESLAHLPHKPVQALSPPGSVPAGVGRSIPYTAAAAVYSGSWRFAPAFGGLRVALPHPPPPGLAPAAHIAARPAAHGYVLHADTFVPAALSPGDRHLLSRA